MEVIFINILSKIKTVKELLIVERLQFKVYFALSIVVMLFTAITTPNSFHRFLGDVNPLIILSLTVLIGFFFLSFLLSKTKFSIYSKKNIKSYLLVSVITILFGIEIIVADIWIVDYSSNINISFPQSLSFYPAIGFLVEILFHVFPLSIIIFFVSHFIKRLNFNHIVLISIIIVALIEPLYQVTFLNQTYSITVVYTGIHVFLISLSQLFIFQYYDFVTMYLFRLIYYLIWHIVWGYFRLDILFNL